VSRARPTKPPPIVIAAAAEAGPGRATRIRQRQRLIDACISALHIHGPSRTTVEKVVAIADLSPGIVRFYFDSKAAMLVASLEYLAAEFEQRVLLPVSQLRHAPVQALELLVDLYLDPQIASPRKVSVWYSFWGEASSRQEYYDICGKKDEDFAVLVRALIERLIASTGATHLDADGIALGLIGVLEVLWQTFAFQSEASIDRAASRRRSLAYLRSVFPGQFGSESAAPSPAALPDRYRGGESGDAAAIVTATADGADQARTPNARLPAWAYAHAALLAAERDRLLRPAWQFIGHDAEVAAAGDFLSGDLAAERALVVRDERGRLRAFRNACRRRPHALVIARSGHLDGAIHCASHGLTYRLDGRLVDGDTPGDLSSLELKQLGPLILVRAVGAAAALRLAVSHPETPSDAMQDVAAEPDWSAFRRMRPVGMQQIEVAADWKLIVERWLEAPASQRQFLAPNQLIELRRDAALILQVIPVAPGRCRIQRFDYLAGAARGARAAKSGDSSRGGALAGWQRQVNAWLQQEIALAESTQTGLAGAADEFEDSVSIAAPLAQFRQSITALLPAIPTLPERPL
jgi:phenylpropionate dioxygenase-like ring-hydroxylating dioxygenase large terminal subunit/AcrR family transcriptional regulator